MASDLLVLPSLFPMSLQHSQKSSLLEMQTSSCCDCSGLFVDACKVYSLPSLCNKVAKVDKTCKHQVSNLTESSDNSKQKANVLGLQNSSTRFAHHNNWLVFLDQLQRRHDSNCTTLFGIICPFTFGTSCMRLAWPARCVDVMLRHILQWSCNCIITHLAFW